METITTENLRQFSYGFNLLVPFEDSRDDTSAPINGVGDTWSVSVVKPDGTILTKTTGTFPDDTRAEIAIPIDAGDLDRAGTYSAEVVKTTASRRIKFAPSIFEVSASLPTP